jgi:hypothetical protein
VTSASARHTVARAPWARAPRPDGAGHRYRRSFLAKGEHHRDVDQYLPAVTHWNDEPRAIDSDGCPVRPTRSASIRIPIDPECDTTPEPSAVTDRPADHGLCFTCEVPLNQEFLLCRKTKFPLKDRHFRALQDRVGLKAMKDRAS